ncbi:hypothetical protein E4U21_007640 [Claviceps maximensis]|nr:hypothetical protein E4U21_007640 [Claviceps maximensis]
MSQQSLPRASYPPPGSRAAPSHPAFGHSIYGYQSHQNHESHQGHQSFQGYQGHESHQGHQIHQGYQQAQQQPRHHLQPRHPLQHHEIHGGHGSNPPPSTHPHSLSQHVQPHASSHGPLQHLLPSPQMPPPPCHVSRQDDAQPIPQGSVASSMLIKSAGIRMMVPPFSKIDEATGRKYQLDVVQQPKRARMCGFGDKDRRPITPPPCVRLIITDIVTGNEIDCNDIDHSMFVLNVDLWNEDGTKEVNLVRSSAGSPSISSTIPYSYTALGNGEGGIIPYTQHVLASNRDTAFNQSQGISYGQEYQVQPSYGQAPAYPPNNSYGPPQQFFPHHQTYRSDGGGHPLPPQPTVSSYHRNSNTCGPPGYLQDHGSLARMAIVGGQPQGMFTRNLIGSLAASAFRLSDTEDRIGIWFVLQDLSVRTEGPFRLRFSFVNVGPPSGAPRDAGAPKINKRRAPILACCFSEVFNVYSAKKFPGVCESTPLSKTFATQGIKIPIRKDSHVKGGEEDDYGD